MTDEDRRIKKAAAYDRWYVSHRAAVLVHKAAYYQAHKEHKKEHDAAYYRAHKEHKREHDIVYRRIHKEHIAAYREVHKKYYAAYGGRWAKEHPEHMQAEQAARRAAMHNTTPIDQQLTKAQWHEILEEYRYRCAYCGCKLGYSKGEPHPTMDHVIPLSRGGLHTKKNIVPACQHCNSTKNAKTPEERFGIRIVS